MTSGHLGIWLVGHLRSGYAPAGYRAVGLLACVLAANCAVGTPSAPDLAGPSELGLSIGMAASPDLIARDGSAQSVITVTARDSSGQPLRNVLFRLDVVVGDAFSDLGTLAARTVQTGNDGRVSVTYTAPPQAAFGAPNEATIRVFASLIGTNGDNAQSGSVSIRLTAPGVIQLPPPGTPLPSFSFSPSSPTQGDDVEFDASASKDADGKIVTYFWNFGDGTTESRPVPTVDHKFSAAKKYTVVLTVTDDTGHQASTSAVVDIK